MARKYLLSAWSYDDGNKLPEKCYSMLGWAMAEHPRDDNTDGRGTREPTLTDGLFKIETNGGAWHGKANFIDLGLAACRTIHSAQAELLVLASQRAAATDLIECVRIEVAVKAGLAWLERSTHEFNMIVATMDTDARRSLWNAIAQLPTS